ncbi:OmpA family protein [Treponema sp. OMZ 799]|uniref:FlgD immunoglobulin-like domain containing protein n=1 Tax=Treponema sp. OMZ 799 TaxID=2563668 RepID=UPI0020A387E1|nr:FlgD immunoglobulin-like domain containing protein [Treponema sp. OMZ 799]UTC78393.1 OmpA family protein [Treponema sp. OMZ 799]
MFFLKFGLKAKVFFVLCFFLIGTAVFAYDPLPGGEEKPTLQSPAVAGGQNSVTGGPFGDTVPGSLAVNPALGGAEQRPILDASYFLIAGLGKEKGFGHAANAALLYPFRWGNIAGSLHFLNAEFDSLKLGTMGGLRFSYSKDLTEKLSVGVGSYADFGKDWGLGLDIGALYMFGDLGFLKNSKLGVSITGLGKTYNPKATGIKGGASSGSPAIITPRAGFAATLVDIDGFQLGMHTDLSAPFFQNLVINTGLHMLMADMISFKTGFVINTLEAIHKKQSFIPSFNIGVNIKIKSQGTKDSFLKKNGWEENEIRPEFAAKPFHNGIWAFGGGVNVHFGLKDNEGPKIQAEMPESGILYFSPNNDGENDAMEIPLKITDKRYVTAWSCEIKDEKGNTVRTISNKIPLREMKDAASFFKLLGKSKEGVEVPGALRWDGRTDSGETAPDGKYSFIIRAQDDNKNKSESQIYTAHIDKTPPSLTFNKPQTQDALIFSPDGDGNKDVFIFDNTGSNEDLWTASISNAQGKVIRTIQVKDKALSPLSWDGKDDAGIFVPDGVYSYKIESMDRAKNKTVSNLSNIIVDTYKPSININIDKNAFSPASKSNNKINFIPSIPITKGLEEWKIEVKNQAGAAVKTYAGSPSKIEPKTFDGKDEEGKLLPEGSYKAFISARYINGHAPSTQTPSFTLDITPPKAEASASQKLFSPDGDGELDTLIFTHKEEKPGTWIAEIYRASSEDSLAGNTADILAGKPAGTPIFTNSFGDKLPPQFEWNGRKTDGSFAEDGKYIYVLRGVDEAQNEALSNAVLVELNTEKADIILQSNYTAFSPNNDGVKDSIEFYPVVKSKTKVDSYAVNIKDSKGKLIKTYKGNTPPKKITWNGQADEKPIVPNGLYSAEFEVELANKNKAKSIISSIMIDTVYPEIQISAPYLAFSPVEGNNKPNLPIDQISSSEKEWTGRFVDSKNKTVKTLRWKDKADKFIWEADDDTGNKVPDEKYTYIAEAEDEAGNKTVQKLEGIIVDRRQAKGYITAEHKVFSPTGNGIKDVQNISVLTNIDAEIDNWNIQVSDVESGKFFAEWSSKKEEKLPKKLVWDGKSGSSKAPDGRYMATMYIEYKKGDIVTAFTDAFILSTQAPKIDVSTSPKYFSPDNDGTDDDLYISLKADSKAGIENWKFEIAEPEENGGKLFWQTSGKEKITKELIWDGRSLSGETVQSATDYPFTFTVTDKVGLTSVYRGYIPVDILVIRDGDKLKIAVPSIIFRANAADFNGLDQAIVDKNKNILKRIAVILNKFPEYQVQVEGHANTTTGTEKEETAALLPLSKLRADAVRQFLIKEGVRSSRLSSVGMGSSKPVASLSDRDNWWKNRRVEFILIKQ